MSVLSGELTVPYVIVTLFLNYCKQIDDVFVFVCYLFTGIYTNLNLSVIS